MKKIFIADKAAFSTSEQAVLHILSAHFQMDNAKVTRGDYGKPFLSVNGETPFFFSVSHTKDKLFIVFCDENVGIDAESLTRQVDYLPIIKRFPLQERKEIVDTACFLKHWTTKESAVKWLGGSLAHDLYKLRLEKNALFYNDIPMPVTLTSFTIDGILLTVCSEQDFTDVEFITL